MRPSRCPLLAAALALTLLGASPSVAEPLRQLVIQVSPDRAEAPLERRERLATRLETLSLRVLGSLGEGMPPGLGTSAAPRRTPFDLDPSRIFLLEAPDSLAAVAAARQLEGDPRIDWVELNQPRTPALVSLGPGFPDDPMFRDSRQWGLRNVGPSGAYGGVAGADIHALEAWGWSVGSNDVRLAVADTGIDPNHPDLQALMPGGGTRIELGMNVTSDPSTAFSDSFGHGTPVAGVFGARTGEGPHFDSLGVAGVCGGDGHDNLGCRLVPIKITPGRTGLATSYDISRAILYATLVGARAMNLSFAGLAPSRLERNALFYAITHGCVVVAAAGNSGGNIPQPQQYPAAYAADGLCIQVGATDPFDQRAGFSSYGPGLDLVAPGVNIWTTFMTYPSAAGAVRNGYVPGSGTSFAAPFVTGAVGLLAAARPELTDTDFQNLLRQSADDIGDPGVDARTGYGRLNAARALAAVRPTFGIWHDEVAAQVFQPGAIDSIRVAEPGLGNLGRVRTSPAQLIMATATVAIPDSFIDSVRVWPRIGGTTTITGSFRIPFFAPWSRVTAQDERSFTLSGFIYHLEKCAECAIPEDAYLPLPPDQARFGFTVIGRVDRPPSIALDGPVRTTDAGDSVTVSWSASDPDEVSAVEVWLEGEGTPPLRLARLPGAARALRVALPCPGPSAPASRIQVVALDEHGPRHDRAWVEAPLTGPARDCTGPAPPRALEPSPNPFRSSTLIGAPPGSRLTIVDVAGRVVRRAAVPPGSTGFRWDGRGDRGQRLGPGIFLVRCEGPGVRARAKVLKLE